LLIQYYLLLPAVLHYPLSHSYLMVTSAKQVRKHASIMTSTTENPKPKTKNAFLI